MPIPILGLLGLIGTATGIGKSVKAAIDQKDAKETNETAERIVSRAKDAAEKSRKNAGDAITDLGKRKINILNESIVPIITSFERLHNVELTASTGIEELQNFKLDEQFFKELREMGDMASSVLGGAAAGTVLGGIITSFGARGATSVLGRTAAGTLFSALKGISLKNATLSFLSGGLLSGFAGGATVLGGLVSGPSLAIMGFVVGAKSKENKNKAYANYADARSFEEEMHTVRVRCKAIRMRANMYERLLIKLDAILAPLQYELEAIINEVGTDYSTYSEEQKKTVAATLATVAAIKAVIDTPILTEDGNLTDESETIPQSVTDVLKNFNNK